MAQQEQVYWDVLQQGGRDYYIAVSEKGWVELSLGNETLEEFTHNVTKRVKNADFTHNAEKVAAYKGQLAEYFAGQRTEFDLPLDFRGTEFQKKIWAEIAAIPFGQTCTYLDLAKKVGNVKAVRAVGGATGANPIPIIVPCHRVIGTNGRLTGFAGGLPLKIELLKLEGIFIDI